MGALSKFVHSRTGDIKLVHLRNLTDALICTVAHLDASCQPINLNAISDALDQVLTAYQKVLFYIISYKIFLNFLRII